MIIPNIWEKKKCSKPPTSFRFGVSLDHPASGVALWNSPGFYLIFGVFRLSTRGVAEHQPPTTPPHKKSWISRWKNTRKVDIYIYIRILYIYIILCIYIYYIMYIYILYYMYIYILYYVYIYIYIIYTHYIYIYTLYIYILILCLCFNRFFFGRLNLLTLSQS